MVGLDVLGGAIDVYGAFINTNTSSGGGLVCFVDAKPDFNVTNKNQPVSGNVSTNDKVATGTTYGTPVSVTQPAGATPDLTFNSDGTYTFNTSTPGVYVYNVPVCAPGQSSNCPPQPLTITVLDPTVNTNPPVANTDIAATVGPNPVTVNVKANDGPGNPGGTLGTPTIATPPANGSATVNGDGNVVYTPNAGFVGTDQLTYQVCEQPGGQCATATVSITVKAQGSANTTLAADDYVSTAPGVAVAGNVKTNDTDPEGNAQTVTAQNTTVAGKGTLVLNADGSFSFTPAANFTGPVDFTYVTCDNGTPQACANGTLHVLVNPATSTAYPDFAVTNKSQPVSGNVSTNDKVPSGTTYGQPGAPTSSPNGSTPSLTVNPDGTYSFSATTPGVYVYNVPVCAPGQSSNCPPQPLTITVLDPTVNTNPPVANTDIAATVGPNPVTVNVKANDGPGNPGGTLGTPTITTPPANGSATVNGDGNVVYTPNAGFVGTDQLTYQVCEQPGGQCATATVSITVKAQGSANTTLAADDYVSTAPGVAVAGNVKTNDTDPEGNAQTVTAQNTTVAGKGTLVLNADGSFSFTPAANFTGPVDFTYVTCDNGTPQACANGTLHVLVIDTPKPDLTPIINLPAGNFTSSGSDAVRNFTVRIFEGLGQPTSSGNVVVAITVPIGYTIAYDASLTSINVSGGGTVAVDNTKWAVSSSSPDGLQIILTIKPGQFIPGNGSSFLGFTITRVTANSGSTSNITTNVFDDPNQTYDSNPLNNIFARNINAL
ncbi:Ig-like domain-containing protein [Fibrisoma limi]|uniref:Ig-like domain-containing protein n=1 Tax=Fibrisoma limi TaxID=663275 RepID=UPI001788C332|nr:Ig-like domain-containing protein [Fibrisoma limi]